MKKLVVVLISISALFLLWGCPDGINKPKYYNAFFPEFPINFTDVNSEFDDYNSALPETHFGKQLIFSSNRRSSGESFDIIGENLHATWYWETGELIVNNSYYWQNTDYVGTLLNKIDKNNNQFAPYSISYESEINNNRNTINFLAYSTNANADCYTSEFMYHVAENGDETGEVFGPYQIPFLGDCNQQYISFFGPEVASIDNWSANPNYFTEMYFDHSSETGSNIYHINIPDTIEFMQFLLSDSIVEKEEITILNSSFDDRCPFINGNFMVFTSNRPGGYGGYDLYYSYYYDGNWIEPINFGERINSEFDEFRPVVMQAMGYNNDLMVFSSNRPGGLGGFDLYYVGIDKINPVLYLKD